MERAKIFRQNLMDLSEFMTQFHALKPRGFFIYHRGNLSCDRRDNLVVHQIANQALMLGTDRDRLILRPFGSTKPRPEDYGMGMAILAQRRIGSRWSRFRIYEYIIIRRGV